MVSLEVDIQRVKAKNGISFTVQIVTQRLRGSRADFIATNGFKFTSLSCPAIVAGYNVVGNLPPMMYIRGSSGQSDNDMMYTDSIGYIEKLKLAVIEYNIMKEDIR